MDIKKKSAIGDRVVDLSVKQIILHDPATIIIWGDGTKTVVKANGGDTYDKEKGIALCFMKRVLGNKFEWYETMRRLLRRGEKKDSK